MIRTREPSWLRLERRLLIVRMELRQGGRLVSRGHAFGEEVEIVRVLHYDTTFRNQSIGMPVGIDGDARQMFGGREFPNAGGKTSVAFTETSDGGFQGSNILVHFDRAQVFDRVLADVGIFAGLVGGAPQQTRGSELPRMLRHLRRHYLHEGMCVG